MKRTIINWVGLAIVTLTILGRVSDVVAAEAELTVFSADKERERMRSIMERRFLDGRITAKQYQLFLNQYRPPAILPEITNTPPVKKIFDAPSVRDPQEPKKVVPSFPYTNAPITEPRIDPIVEAGTNAPTTKADPTLSDVEARMNELLRLQEQRKEQGSGEGAGDKAQAELPRRARLNQLLRLYIQDKISEEDYNARRAEILAEPDPSEAPEKKKP